MPDPDHAALVAHAKRLDEEVKTWTDRQLRMTYSMERRTKMTDTPNYTTPEAIAELRRSMEVRTEGPYRMEGDLMLDGGDCVAAEFEDPVEGQIIAAACNAVPALLKLVEEQQERIGELEGRWISAEISPKQACPFQMADCQYFRSGPLVAICDDGTPVPAFYEEHNGHGKWHSVWGPDHPEITVKKWNYLPEPGGDDD